jgi:Asp-tRNA(Asn)/Glu-tRNA(Gln) amidotransferase A subunit family amidase
MHSMLSTYMAFGNVPWIARQLFLRNFMRADNRRLDYSEVYDRMSDLDDSKYDDILKRKDQLTADLERFFANYDLLIVPVTPGPAIKHNPEHLPIALDRTSIYYWDYFHYPMCFNATGHPALTIRWG